MFQTIGFIGLALFIILGLALPKLVNKSIKKRRQNEYQEWELGNWGFHARPRQGPWINYVDYGVARYSEIAKGKFFYCDWLVINDGWILVNPGKVDYDHLKEQKEAKYDFSRSRTYAWDGCTPKVSFLWLGFFGTPDWWSKELAIKKLNPETGDIEDKKVFWPLAHYASLIHDGLFQYLDSIPIAKKDVDGLFFEMLKEAGMIWPVAKLYHLAVKYFGASDVEENEPKPPQGLKLFKFPDIKESQ